MKTLPTNSRISTYTPQQSDPHFPDETRSASSPNWTPSPPSNSCPGLGLTWSWPGAATPTPPRHSQPSTATTSSTSASQTTTTHTPPELHDILHKKFRVVDSISTTTSTSHTTPKKSHHGRHKNAVRRRPTPTTSPRQRRPTRRGHRLLMHRLPSTHIGQARRRTLLTPNPSAHPNQPPHRGTKRQPCNARQRRLPHPHSLRLPDTRQTQSISKMDRPQGPTARDQRLQQVDTIMAQLQDKITQSKPNTTLLNTQQNQTQSAL